MSAKKLIPFIIILAVLAGVAVLQKSKDTSTPITEQFTQLTPEALEADDITRLELYAGTDEDKVVLEKEDDAWRVTSHFNAPAKTETVEEYLDKVVGVKGEYRAKAASDEDLSSWELKDDEAFHVAAYKSSGDEPAVHLLFGKAPGYKSVFLRQEGSQEIYEEATNLRRDAGVYDDGADAKPKPDHWLNKDVLKLDKEKVTRVALTYPDKELVFEKKEVPQETPEPEETEDGEDAEPTPPPAPVFEWSLVSGGLGDQEYKETARDNILSKLANLTATNVADPEKLAEWGLDTPAFRCEVALDGEEPVVLEGGRPDLAGDAYVRLADAEAPVVYQVSSWNFEQLFPQGEDLYNLPKPGVTTDEIASITVRRPGIDMSMTKAGTNWKINQPDVGLETQTTTLGTLATTLGSWKPEDYAAPGTDAGPFDRSVTYIAEGQTHTLHVGGPSKSVDGVYVKVDDSDQILTMKDMDAKKVFFEPRDAFKLALVDFEDDDVVRVDLTKGGETIALTPGTGAWTYTDNTGTFPADAAECDALLQDLNEVQAADIRFDMPALAVEPYGAVTIYLKDGGSIKLTFGPEEDGTHLMAYEGKGRVFEMRAADVEDLLGDFARFEKPEEETEAPAESEAADAAAPVAPVEPADVPAAENAGEADAAPAQTPQAAAPEAPLITVQPAPAAAPAVEIPIPATGQEESTPTITVQETPADGS